VVTEQVSEAVDAAERVLEVGAQCDSAGSGGKYRAGAEIDGADERRQKIRTYGDSTCACCGARSAGDVGGRSGEESEAREPDDDAVDVGGRAVFPEVAQADAQFVEHRVGMNDVAADGGAREPRDLGDGCALEDADTETAGAIQLVPGSATRSVISNRSIVVRTSPPRFASCSRADSKPTPASSMTSAVFVSP
jgi:hypothetical protein